MDIYTTDAKIERFQLRVLEDDRKFFPRYEAVLLYRLDVPQRFPGAWAKLQKLEGRIDERTMIRLNAAAELQGRSFAEAAALLDSGSNAESMNARRTFLRVAVRPGFLAADRRAPGAGVRFACREHRGRRAARDLSQRKSQARPRSCSASVGVIQTIPSLALFAFLIALLGHHRHACRR